MINFPTKKVGLSPYLKTSYSKDMVIEAFDTPLRKIWILIGGIVLILFPFLANKYLIHIVNLIAIASIGSLALNFLCGNAGLLSLGHAGFIAAGAFTTAIMTIHFGQPVWVVLPVAGLVGAALGLIAGMPSLRLKGIYLGIVTLAFHYIIIYALSEYQFYGGFGFGVSIKDFKIGNWKVTTEKEWYFILMLSVWLAAIFIKNLLRSRPGRALIAIHNRDIAAEIMGVNIGAYKIMAFIVSTSITTMSGCLYAYYTNVANIAEFSFGLTVSYLAMIIVGGLGSILGSIMGSFLITLVPFLLMFLFDFFEIKGVWKDYFFALQSGIFGIIIIVFLLFEPMGLAEIWRRIRDYFMLWPFRYKALKVTKR